MPRKPRIPRITKRQLSPSWVWVLLNGIWPDKRLGIPADPGDHAAMFRALCSDRARKTNIFATMWKDHRAALISEYEASGRTGIPWAQSVFEDGKKYPITKLEHNSGKYFGYLEEDIPKNERDLIMRPF